MCGIMGYIGEENAAEIIINGLEELEYRGYDSAGLAVFDGKELKIVKTLGSPSRLKSRAKNLRGSVGIGHTRWATHGAATEANAHPHAGEKGLFTVVHNGIIENYLELKSELDGVKFKSDTDTEVVAQLLEKQYSGDLKGTVSGVLKTLKGSYAFGIFCRDYPDTIICARKSSPLFVGISSSAAYLASDILPISEVCSRVFRLNDGEIGIIQKDSLRVYDTDGCRIKKSEVKIKAYDRTADKGGYEHFMLKEIMEQPSAVRRTLDGISKNDRLSIKNIRWSTDEIKKISNVRFVACGSAYHAGLTGAYASERLFRRPSQACTASEFRYMHPCLDENSLVVIISQSGETADTLAALRIAKESGAKTVSIVNVENSTIAAESDCVIMTRAGREIAVATTKAYSAQLAVIYSLIIQLAVSAEELNRKEAAGLFAELTKIPDKIEEILLHFNAEKYAQAITESNYICFIGRGTDFSSAQEASLKLKEISYIPCEAYPAGELKHGTISLIDKNSTVIALCCSSETKSKTESNINEAAARGANIISVTDTDGSGEITVPKTHDLFYPMLEIIPLQLIAYHSAKIRGCEIDKPRNLAKSVTVE